LLHTVTLPCMWYLPASLTGKAMVPFTCSKPNAVFANMSQMKIAFFSGLCCVMLVRSVSMFLEVGVHPGTVRSITVCPRLARSEASLLVLLLPRMKILVLFPPCCPGCPSRYGEVNHVVSAPS